MFGEHPASIDNIANIVDISADVGLPVKSLLSIWQLRHVTDLGEDLRGPGDSDNNGNQSDGDKAGGMNKHRQKGRSEVRKHSRGHVRAH